MLKAHAAVDDAMVVGVPDERWGQRVAAVVSPRAGADVTLAAVDAHCRPTSPATRCRASSTSSRSSCGSRAANPTTAGRATIALGKDQPGG